MAKIHKRKWIVDLLKEAEGHIDEEKLAELLEQRGRTCIGETYIKKAKQAAKDAKNDKEFLDNLEKVYPVLTRDGDKVYVVYPKCYCPGMKDFKEEVPSSYCYCSVGWVKEMFEQALGRPVEVRLEGSIIRGDDECRLRVML
jgi:predicted Zn-ribbon and HTH transcriptional regulator